MTAVLLKEGHSFKKHTAVKAALHKDLIRTGLVEPGWGKFYNRIFDSGHEGDYQPLRTFDAEEVKLYLDQGAGFITEMERLWFGDGRILDITGRQVLDYSCFSAQEISR